MALTNVQQVRLLVQDNSPGLYIVSDDEINFFLERNANNVNRAALETAKVILLNLSMRSDNTIDIMSIRNSKTAEQYRLALELFLRDPSLNPVLNNCTAYFGGVSVSDMQSNDAVLDNNIVQVPAESTLPRTDYFSV